MTIVKICLYLESFFLGNELFKGLTG